MRRLAPLLALCLAAATGCGGRAMTAPPDTAVAAVRDTAAGHPPTDTRPGLIDCERPENARYCWRP